MSEVSFWLSSVLVVGCLLLCLQKEKRVVPMIRESCRWAWHIPIISAVFTVGLIALFGLTVSLESTVTVYSSVLASFTVCYFLYRLSG